MNLLSVTSCYGGFIVAISMSWPVQISFYKNISSVKNSVEIHSFIHPSIHGFIHVPYKYYQTFPHASAEGMHDGKQVPVAVLRELAQSDIMASRASCRSSVAPGVLPETSFISGRYRGLMVKYFWKTYATSWKSAWAWGLQRFFPFWGKPCRKLHLVFSEEVREGVLTLCVNSVLVQENSGQWAFLSRRASGASWW